MNYLINIGEWNTEFIQLTLYQLLTIISLNLNRV